MNLVAQQAGAYLHHIQLLSAEPERLAAFYARVLDMRLSRVGEIACVGPHRRVFFAKGPSNQLGFAAFAVRNDAGLSAIRDSAAVARVSIEASPTRLFENAFAVRDPDGNLIAFGLAPQDETDAGRRHGRLQHLTLATKDVGAFEDFYAGKLGFFVSDRVRDAAGRVTTSFTTCNHEHHTVAAFLSPTQGIDHHSYEAGDWVLIRDWCDHIARERAPLMWGPGRHGPGNNLFVFIEDPDENWIEISAELEVLYHRPTQEWPHEPRTLNLWGGAIMRV